MNGLTLASLFVPSQLLLLPLIVGAGFMMILGWRRRAHWMLGAAGFVAVLPVLEGVLVGILDALPWWVTVLALVFGVLALVGAVSTLMLGKQATERAKSRLVSKAVLWMLVLPFKMLGGVFRVARGGRRG